MSHPTVRISESGRDLLRQLADRERASMQAVLERALESYRRQRFLEQVNEAYAELLQTPAAEELGAELAQWDATLSDGLSPGHSVAPRTRRPRPRGRKRS
jgi:hypothetical protein